MDSSGKKIGPPLLALLLVGVIGVAVRFAPGSPTASFGGAESTTVEPLAFERPTAESSAPGTFSGALGTPEDLLKRAAEFGIETVLPPTGPLRSVPAPTAPSFIGRKQGQTRVLSDREVFEILHPPYYLDYLSTLEDLMIQDDQLRPEEKQVFDSEAKVIAFLRDKVFDYIVLKGITVPEDRPRFERGLEVVQELHRGEASYLRYDAQSSRYRVTASLGPLYKKINGELSSRGFLSEFFAPRAQAQAECSQSGAGSQEAGSNVAAVCCNCTINGVPVGCLNAVCSGRPAIYDSATGICGCG